ncbi:MAG: C4-type zinc ribbon domain-containing protein [Gemmatimonadota bacterium]|nr:C4-type zinc ribbon domain-containing protein [Gemmatimonadota bacterium]
MEASDTVGDLLTLQETDLEILRITTQLDVYDNELAALRESVEELQANSAKITSDKEEAEERVRRYQRAVQAGRATLKRLETRAAAVENMQQHFAVRTETDTARRNLRAAEEDALDAMQDVETLSERLGETEAALAEANDSLAGRETEIGGERVDLEGDLAAHSDSKNAQEERLDRRSLRLYQSVRGGKTHSALASLTPDGACGHCFTAVPKQRQADIRAGRELAVCEGCGVILYAGSSGD